MATHGIRADRSPGGQPLSVRGDGRRRAPAYDDCIENIDIGGPAMIRAAAKNHADVAVVVEPEDYARAARRACQHNGGSTTLALRKNSPPRPMRAPRAYDAAISNWFADELGDPAPALPRRSAASSPRRCATARTRTRARRSIARPSSAPASPPRGRCRASSSPTTTSTTPTRPMNASPSSIPSAPPPVAIIKHANPCGVAEGGKPRRGLPQGAGLRSDLGVRRHRRAQPHARRRGRARHHRDFHRGDHRAGRDRRGDRDRRARRRTCGCCWPAACPIRAPTA